MIQRPINGILVFNLIPQLQVSLLHSSQKEIDCQSQADILISFDEEGHHCLQSTGEKTVADGLFLIYISNCCITFSCFVGSGGNSKRHTGSPPLALLVSVVEVVSGVVEELSITNNKPGDGC